MKDKSKIKKIYSCISIVFYIVALMYFFLFDNITMGIVYMSLGTVFFSIGVSADKDEKSEDEADEDAPTEDKDE